MTAYYEFRIAVAPEGEENWQQQPEVFPAQTHEERSRVFNDLLIARRKDGLRGLFLESESLEDAKAYLEKTPPQKIPTFFIAHAPRDYSEFH